MISSYLAPCLQGHDLGVISEAGVPAVADPGALVVERAHGMGIRVIPLCGPSSVLMGLMASGLSGQCFAFNGYLPVDKAGPEGASAGAGGVVAEELTGADIHRNALPECTDVRRYTVLVRFAYQPLRGFGYNGAG